MKKITLKKQTQDPQWFYETDDEIALICVEFIELLGFDKAPRFVTIYASSNRIHRKGCHKVSMVLNSDNVWLDDKRLPHVFWHRNLENAIKSHGLGNTFYIRVIEGKA